jgi:hypothetical protein
MISGKGILYTVIAATSAAVLVGSMLTGGKRKEPLRKFGNKVQNLLGRSDKSKVSDAQSEIKQVSPMGHS